ncbi:MAG TPA: Crp/Fnr family transcriptional regulator [Aggregatilinea sp.]|jgi:CRP-like cAMP-binding protein|uniref:Crp/Fnr family transcriptional regulator n=1 Tax=Aggregatilinea sp. TaxID=2806333 RepID=UPI002C052186|nr:Crp/Fnr family transcriptional regulator [Aggregatilinea sp.]HML22694.1 Crp/Fnr family transcriptional regulator [Aggregatilinea sp.]
MSVEINYFKRSRHAVSFSCGDLIFDAGAPGELMYGVQSGEVRLIHPDGKLERVEAGGIFGEAGFIERQPHTMAAVALTDCTLIPVDRWYFQFLTNETPGFALMVMQTLLRRLRGAGKGDTVAA